VHRRDDTKSVVRPVQEVRVPERDVPGTHLDELRDVRENRIDRYQTCSTAVDDRDRTVATTMGTPVTGLDVAGQTDLFGSGKAGVTIEGRQQVTGWQPEASSSQFDDGVRAVIGST
jgi:hypothetical protein